jgi:predicted HAD superfamily Cof-like phosphohydrolase
MKTDKIVEQVLAKYKQRSEVGIKKYGTTLQENNNDNFLKHLQEELMDASLYVEKLMSQQKENKESFVSVFSKVIEFNEAFKIKFKDEPLFNIEDKLLRFKLMQEENTEYLEAKNIIDVADALGDQLYILVGTILKHGLQHVILDVFNEIHESNMSKLEYGKPVMREDGKILKGENYFKPNLAKFL